ncbi:predicted protein [Naegleria gruberi]|uniref:Predicted protein n=1 Tax=Naegleria gruberi TaxID=5762 RepID=D2VHE5_NAEGR|nr:uncharacterized protein NAEGRDRAFT_68188 [Naegleria gruberi]EFC43874.1 predicted protein [Naegleria gruberi]|eukprot:XP_002676618.1 predicted protein [Naegleria gruberi strain NEG-M]
MITSNFHFIDELETFFDDQEIIQSLFNFISNHHSDETINEKSHYNYCKITFEWEKLLLINEEEEEEDGENSFDEISARIIKELIGNNLFRDPKEGNIFFRKQITKAFPKSDIRNDEEEFMMKRVEKLMIVVDELIFMIREDRILLNDVEEIRKRRKLVSFWISIANAIVLYLFYAYLVIDFEKCGVSQDWIVEFNSKMENSYVQYVLYQYLKTNFYKTASISLKLQDVDVNFSKVYDVMDSIKFDLSKEDHLPNTEMDLFEILLHIFTKYFFCKSAKSGEFLHKYEHYGSVFTLDIVMNYLISIGNRELQSTYAQKIFECFSRKMKVSITSHTHYNCLGMSRNFYIILHAVTASFISALKQPTSENLFTYYNDMILLVNRTFSKEDKLKLRLSKHEIIESKELDLFNELLKHASLHEIYMRSVREKQLFYDKTDELILFNPSQSTERNILESIAFKAFILIPYTSIGSFIATNMIPKIGKLEILVKCCMECYFNEHKIENHSPFLSAIFYILKAQLSNHTTTTHTIIKSYQLCFNMIKEGKEAVIIYYPRYLTDSHYQNSKNLLDKILVEFTTNISQVYPRELRIVLNQVICCLMDKGQKEEQNYISMFNQYFRHSINQIFDNYRSRLKDPFIYKYLTAFALSSPHYVDILTKFKSPKKLEQIIDELYPKLSLRNLIFVDSNQRHRPFISLTSTDLASLEDLTIVELMKRYKSFIQFSLYPQLAYLTDVSIHCFSE